MATATAATTRDRLWLALLGGAYGAGLAVSWHRWANPLIDVGREMNQPLRLASGERLYSDVRHIYGPLSPWFHAALYHLFGPSLTVLYTDGIITGAVILALIYWLGRQIMSPAAAGTATLIVMWICVFRPAGIYILPYSYNALHGTALGLITLSLLVDALKRPQPRAITFAIAGVMAALTFLAKTEMGVAAMAAGVTAGLVAAYPDARRGIGFAAVFVGVTATLVAGAYTLIATQVGWSTLVSDSWLFVANVPPELAYYNARISGLDHPLKSIGRMLIAALKVGIIAILIGAISSLIGNRSSSPRRSIVFGPWGALACAAVLLIVMALTTGLDWDKGPFLAMPFLLVGWLVVLLRRLHTDGLHTRILLTFTVFALASIARTILHVRSGGAYGSFLLPMSVVIFTYLWVGPFADSFSNPRVSQAARAVALTLILINAIVTAVMLGYRFRTHFIVPISTPRGTMIVEPAVGVAWNEALAYIDQHTHPGDAVAAMPEGTSLDFLSGRRNPLREEIMTPGYLNEADEARAIRQLRDADTRLILLPNRPTTEFGPTTFGRDYAQRLMRWIEANYTPCATFGNQTFFIHAWCANGERPEDQSAR